jgi:hypothetical protein
MNQRIHMGSNVESAEEALSGILKRPSSLAGPSGVWVKAIENFAKPGMCEYRY